MPPFWSAWSKINTPCYFITIKELSSVGSVDLVGFTFLMRSREGLGALYYKTDEHGLSLVHHVLRVGQIFLIYKKIQYGSVAKS
jgi:hypothetical protein